MRESLKRSVYDSGIPARVLKRDEVGAGAQVREGDKGRSFWGEHMDGHGVILHAKG